MTKEEMVKKIEEIKNHRFCLAMIDRWTAETFNKDKELFNELMKLERAIKEN